MYDSSDFYNKFRFNQLNLTKEKEEPIIYRLDKNIAYPWFINLSNSVNFDNNYFIINSRSAPYMQYLVDSAICDRNIFLAYYFHADDSDTNEFTKMKKIFFQQKIEEANKLFIENNLNIKIVDFLETYNKVCPNSTQIVTNCAKNKTADVVDGMKLIMAAYPEALGLDLDGKNEENLLVSDLDFLANYKSFFESYTQNMQSFTRIDESWYKHMVYDKNYKGYTDQIMYNWQIDFPSYLFPDAGYYFVKKNHDPVAIAIVDDLVHLNNREYSKIIANDAIKRFIDTISSLRGNEYIITFGKILQKLDYLNSLMEKKNDYYGGIYIDLLKTGYNHISAYHLLKDIERCEPKIWDILSLDRDAIFENDFIKKLVKIKDCISMYKNYANSSWDTDFGNYYEQDLVFNGYEDRICTDFYSRTDWFDGIAF